MSFSLRRRVALAALSSGLLLPASAFAQDEAQLSAARTLGQEGVTAAREGRCEEAIDKLSRAKKLLPVPSIIVRLGECQVSLGKVVAGTENLQAAARAVLPERAPDAFVEAQNRARKVLPEALKKLARLKLEVEASANTTITVTDNGESVDSVLLGVDRPADPTKHVISASAPGFLTATAEVTLVSGQTEKLVLKLEPDPNAVKPAPVVTPPGETGPKPEQPVEPPTALVEQGSSPLVPAGGIALGVGGASLILGAVFGGLASGKQSSLDEVCVEGLCPASAQADIDSMNTFASVSTATFIIGGVGVALGATLLGIGLASGDSGESVGLFIGPQNLSLQGSF